MNQTTVPVGTRNGRCSDPRRRPATPPAATSPALAATLTAAVLAAGLWLACTPRGEPAGGEAPAAGAPSPVSTAAPIAMPPAPPEPSPATPDRVDPPANGGASPPGGSKADAGATGPTYVYLSRIEVKTLESFPVQVRAELLGNTSDPCVELGEAIVRRTGETFHIELPASRDPQAICAQMLVRFRRSVALEVVGLPKGTYRIEAHGKQASFTLYQDNTPRNR
jgi:hypothetical protein